MKAEQRMADLRETIRVIQRHMEKKNAVHTIYTESGEMVAQQSIGAISPDHEDNHENLVDVGGEEKMIVDAGKSAGPATGQKEVLYLEDFLARPVEISTFAIPAGSFVSSKFDVWDLYTLNPAVRSKLRNYAYLRGTLHLRIAISGTPFHSGRILLSYQPYPLANSNLVQHEAALAINSGWRPLLLNYLSQAPGAVTMDVKQNKPVEMVCPFISTQPMHKLYNYSTTAISDVSSYEDLQDCGSLYFYSINPVNSVTTTPSQVSVQIYAWMTEVELGAPTGTHVGITTESGTYVPPPEERVKITFRDGTEVDLTLEQFFEECAATKALQDRFKARHAALQAMSEADEREVGPVERIATNAAEVAEALESVPYIQPFAMASKMLASSVAKFASIFGWSTPIMIDNPTYVKNRPFSNGANTIGGSTAKKISLDPKQELTVDPRSCGVDTDDMVINAVTSRESYLTTFTWEEKSSPMADRLWRCRVHPQLDTAVQLGAPLRWYVQPTALSFAATPFNFWRGTIKYKFEIVCSSYHRGKLAFYWEPNVGQADLIDADIDTNKQFMRVIDIQETQTVEFCVNWGFPRPWARCMDSTQTLGNFQTFSAVNQSYDYVNGYIGVFPFTALQSPDDSDVEVNVYVSSDDIQFNLLTNGNLPTSRAILTESGYANPEDLSSESVTCLDLNVSTAQAHETAYETFGERPVSFRGLLKRFETVTDLVGIAGATGMNRSIFLDPVIPRTNPRYGFSIAGVEPYLLGYLRYAYLGIRGSVRKRFHLFGEFTEESSYRTNITWDNITSAATSSHTFSTGLGVRCSTRGSVAFHPHTNAGVEFDLPMYTNNLFLFSFNEDLTGTGTGAVEDWFKRFVVESEVNATAIGPVDALVDHAAGEDFSLMRFQGAPFHSHTAV